MRRALWWFGSVGVVAALALSVVAPALAKGASEIVIQGPGLVHPITVKPGDSPSSDQLMPLMIDSRFFLGLCHGRCESRSRLAHRPSRGLGPRYTLTYTMNLEATPHEVVQYVFPYAQPKPVTYMPARQTFLRHRKTGGGWFVAPLRLERELINLGIPATAAEATATPPLPSPVATAGRHGFPFRWTELSILLIAFVVGMWLLFRLFRERRSTTSTSRTGRSSRSGSSSPTVTRPASSGPDPG